ncbi:TIGR01841 family phasin [Altererythrobacter aurantiacus]|uniref:TIGR01841 family phasin n=2 Tax=Parapontixanthobacter aurantiacus TaxID=1463599 RepID=A0A844ZGV2_9SPHN|nr:TIGR01841 family phasin [Parapontixanthobacter aurantiacus]
MADTKNDAPGDAAAERAYADAASGSVNIKKIAEAVDADAPASDAAAEKTAESTALEVKADKAEPAKAKPKKAAAKKVAATKSPSAKAVKKAKPVAKKPAEKKPAPKPAAPVKTAAPKKPAAKPSIKPVEIKKTKEVKMTDTVSIPNYTASFTEAAADMQSRLQAAFDKSTGMAGEMSELAKGNVEAAVESGKVWSEGLQDMSRTAVEDAKSAYETMTADVKQMAAVKNPSELMQLQGEMVRRNFDAMITQTSKNTEAMMKLMNDAFAPISNRVSVAVEKVSKAA